MKPFQIFGNGILIEGQLFLKGTLHRILIDYVPLINLRFRSLNGAVGFVGAVENYIKDVTLLHLYWLPFGAHGLR